MLVAAAACLSALFKKYVFLSREFDSRPGNESCLRRAFQINRKKVLPLQHFQRKRWTKHRKPLLNRLWLLLSQMRRERCIGRNKWGKVPISKLRSSSSGRRQGRGGGHDHGNNAEQHETNSRKAPSSSPPDSSPDAVVVPDLHVFLKGMDGQTRPVAGLTGDSTLRDLYNVSVVSEQSSRPLVFCIEGVQSAMTPEFYFALF